MIRYLASRSFSKPFVALPCDQVVEIVSDWLRYDHKYIPKSVSSTQIFCDFKGCSGVRVDFPHAQVDNAVGVHRDVVTFPDLIRNVGLQWDKAKNVFFVALNDVPHGTVAEVAHPIEKYQMVGKFVHAR